MALWYHFLVSLSSVRHQLHWYCVNDYVTLVALDLLWMAHHHYKNSLQIFKPLDRNVKDTKKRKLNNRRRWSIPWPLPSQRGRGVLEQPSLSDRSHLLQAHRTPKLICNQVSIIFPLKITFRTTSPSTVREGSVFSGSNSSVRIGGCIYCSSFFFLQNSFFLDILCWPRCPLGSPRRPSSHYCMLIKCILWILLVCQGSRSR